MTVPRLWELFAASGVSPLRLQGGFPGRKGVGKALWTERVQHVQTHGVEKEHGTVGAAMMGRAEDKSSSRPLQGPQRNEDFILRM